MESTSEFPLWLVPVILLAFPVAFAGIWGLVGAILATVSGYRSLAAFRLEETRASEGVPLTTPWFAMVGAISYRGRILALRASRRGLILRVSRLFPFHPPICVPWERLTEDDGGVLGRLALGSLLMDGRVRLRVPEATLAEIREARARNTGPDQPA